MCQSRHRKPGLGLRGVIRHWETLTPLLRTRNSYFSQCLWLLSFLCWCYRHNEHTSCVLGRRNFGPFLWSDSILHIPEEMSNRARRGSWWDLLSSGFPLQSWATEAIYPKEYPKEQRLQVKQTSLTIVRKISRHIISCECQIPDLIIMKEVAAMFLAEKGMKVLPCSWKHNLLL